MYVCAPSCFISSTLSQSPSLSREACQRLNAFGVISRENKPLSQFKAEFQIPQKYGRCLTVVTSQTNKKIEMHT